MILGSRLQRIVAAATVTVVTLAVIGVVLVTTTPLGCGPLRSMHVKVSSRQCLTVAQNLSSPTPAFPSATPFVQPSPTGGSYPPPASQNPYPEPASQNPYPQPGSDNPFPGSGSGSSSFTGPLSGSGPPAIGLNCRLPIFAGGPGSGGFILFPN